MIRRNNVINFSKESIFQKYKNIDFILNIFVLIFLILSILIALSDSSQLSLTIIIFIAPTILIIVLYLETFNRREAINLERRFADSISRSAALLENDIEGFHSELYELLKPFEGNIKFYKTEVILKLFAFARIQLLLPQSASALQRKVELRIQLKKTLLSLSRALEFGEYSKAFSAIGDIFIINIYLLRKDEFKKEVQPDYSEFSNRIRDVASTILAFWPGEAKNKTEKLFQEISECCLNGTNVSDEVKYMIIITKWIYSTIYSIELPHEHVEETGLIFFSRYELLAYDISRVAKAFDRNNWLLMEEIISGNYRENRKIPRFALYRYIRTISKNKYPN